MNDVNQDITIAVINDMYNNRQSIVDDQMKMVKVSRAVQLMADVFTKLHPDANQENLCLDFESLGYAVISMLYRANSLVQDSEVDNLVEMLTKNNEN